MGERILRVYDEGGSPILERNISGTQVLSAPEVTEIEIKNSDGEVQKTYTEVAVRISSPEAEAAEAVEAVGGGIAKGTYLSDATVDELQSLAAELKIEGRSSMNKAELVDAIEAAEAE